MSGAPGIHCDDAGARGGTDLSELSFATYGFAVARRREPLMGQDGIGVEPA
jgi:hypothetical protein